MSYKVTFKKKSGCTFGFTGCMKVHHSDALKAWRVVMADGNILFMRDVTIKSVRIEEEGWTKE